MRKGILVSLLLMLLFLLSAFLPMSSSYLIVKPDNSQETPELCTTSDIDLYVGSIRTYPLLFLPGDMIILMTWVINTGTDEAPPTKTAIIIDEETTYTIDTPKIEGGSSVLIEKPLKWSEDSNTHLITVVADYEEDIAETEEFNNEEFALIRAQKSRAINYFLENFPILGRIFKIINR
jgi:subtilase family serine protease